MNNDDLSWFKERLWNINTDVKFKDKHIRRINKHSISDEVEDLFSEFICNKLKDKFGDKLYYDIAPNLTLKFGSNEDYFEFVKKIGKKNSYNKTCYLYKPDLVIYTKSCEIVAIIEFKIDSGWQRDMFGRLGDSISDKMSYAFIRQYIMERLTDIRSNVNVFYSKEKKAFSVSPHCKTYLILGSSGNCKIDSLYDSYQNVFKKYINDNFKKYLVELYPFFKQSIRFDDDSNEKLDKLLDYGCVKDSIRLDFYSRDNKYEYVKFFDDLTNNIKENF